MIAKHEPPPPNKDHHGHLTALSISPAFRGLGLARVFMAILERLSSDGTAGWAPEPADEKEKKELGKDCVDSFFVDLFVRCNNGRAIDMYEKLGYSVFRRVVE